MAHLDLAGALGGQEIKEGFSFTAFHYSYLQ
jgi:hypothetical protein